MNYFLKKCIAEGWPVVCDYDGVLFEARFEYIRVGACNNDEEIRIKHAQGLWLITTPIGFMINLLKDLSNPKFVLSHIHTDIEEQTKIKQLNKYYNGIPLLRANSVEEKIKYLQDIYDKYGGFIYIDDTLPYIQIFENALTEDTMHFFHVSSLYV